MEKKERWIFVLTFIFSAGGVALLSASMGTEYWVESFPIRLVDNKTQDGAINVTDGDPGTKFKGYIHYGLFHGTKQLDNGLGVRVEDIWVSEVVVDDGKFNFGLWVSTIVFVVLGIAMGLTTMAFSALNVGSRPVETITGPIGIYVWSGCAIGLTLVALILYLIMFFQDMKDNIMTERELQQLWTSENRTDLHYSFYFLLLAIMLYSANIVTLILSSFKFKPIRYGHNMNNKALDGVMMY